MRSEPLATCHRAAARSGATTVRMLGAIEEADVLMRIAVIVEAVLAMFGEDPVELASGGEIDVVAGGHHRIEQAEMVGDRVSELLVGAGGENDTAAVGPWRRSGASTTERR